MGPLVVSTVPYAYFADLRPLLYKQSSIEIVSLSRPGRHTTFDEFIEFLPAACNLGRFVLLPCLAIQLSAFAAGTAIVFA